MIEINLLPPEERVHRTSHQPFFSISISISYVVLIVLLLVNLTTYFRNQRQIRVANENLKSIRSQSEQATSTNTQLQKTIRPEAKLIQSLLSNEINWAQVLGLISAHIPGNIWLSNLELHDQSKGWTLTIIGFARPVENASAISSVGEFTNELKREMETILAKDNISADIELLTTTKRKMADRTEIIEFKASYTRNR